MSPPQSARMSAPTPAFAADLPIHYNAADILERSVARHPDKAALHTEAGEFSFRSMADSANRVAHTLRAVDVRIGDTVAILCLDTAEWVAAFFGTLECGGVAAGLSTLLTPSEIAFILNDCRARVLVVHAELLPGLRVARPDCPFLEHVIVVNGDAPTGDAPTGDAPAGDVTFPEWIDGRSTDFVTARTHRDDFATLNYSSGTTGKPKGILHAHKDLVLTAELWGSRTLGLTESDRTFSLAKLFFTFGLGGNLLFPWHMGAAAVLYSGSPRLRGRGASGPAVARVEGADGHRHSRRYRVDRELPHLPVQPARRHPPGQQRQARGGVRDAHRGRGGHTGSPGRGRQSAREGRDGGPLLPARLGAEPR